MASRKSPAKSTTVRKVSQTRPETVGRRTGRPRMIERVTVKKDANLLFEPSEQVERVVAALGSNNVAGLLGVSRSQPSRWRSGEEQMSPINRARISDLDHVLSRLLQILWPEEASDWLTAFSPHLNGRPIDVLALRGAGPVIEAIDALAQGAYA